MAVDVTVEAGDLVVRISGWDAVWALSRGVRVSLRIVTDATVVPRGDLPRRVRFRQAGSYVPGMVRAGRFAGRGWREFWATRWPDRLLVVTCARPPAAFDRVVLDVADPDAVAATIHAARVR